MKVRKFAMDYFVGSALAFVLFIVLIGNVTILDSSITMGSGVSCSSPVTEGEILQALQSILKEGETCGFVSPCDQRLTLRCESSLEISELFSEVITGSPLQFRVFNAVGEPYGFGGWKSDAELRFSPSTLLLILMYALLLIETAALMYALWRQKNLGQALALPLGSRWDQLLRPFLYSLLWSLIVLVMSTSLYALFDHQSVQGSQGMSDFMKTAGGIFCVVLLGPFVEELIFRGVFLKFFIDKNRILLGSIVVSVAFSLFHGLREDGLAWQLYASANFFVGSLILCWLYIKHKNLWSPVIFHATYNAVMVTYFNVFT